MTVPGESLVTSGGYSVEVTAVAPGVPCVGAAVDEAAPEDKFVEGADPEGVFEGMTVLPDGMPYALVDRPTELDPIKEMG